MFVLSVGILRYLCREKNVEDRWYPADSKQQAKVDEYLEWQHLDTRLSCATYFQHKVSFK
jgi:glutathione S-transferase